MTSRSSEYFHLDKSYFPGAVVSAAERNTQLEISKFDQSSGAPKQVVIEPFDKIFAN